MKLSYFLVGLLAACQAQAQGNSTVNATAVAITFADNTCDNTQKGIIRIEFQNARMCHRRLVWDNLLTEA
jgi:hypothetical protein